MEVAVLGGGAGCYAAAADLSEHGHAVRLWRRNAEALAPVIEHDAIVLKDSARSREVSLALATADMAAAVSGVELILIPLPAFAQPAIAAELCPLLREGTSGVSATGRLRQLPAGGRDPAREQFRSSHVRGDRHASLPDTQARCA